LTAILSGQLAAPLLFDTSRLPEATRLDLLHRSQTGASPLRTFGDLLRHPQPPIELLCLVKDYAKGLSDAPPEATHAVPAEIATCLYFATLAAALVRCGQRISALDDRALCRGFEWASFQSWISADLRTLLREAARMLGRT
jgi:hypothetical protein